MPPAGVHQTKLVSVANFQKAYNDLEENLTNQDKHLLAKICNGFQDLAEAVEKKQSGIFKMAIKWFRLYLNMLLSIDPLNKKFVKQFESTIPTAISYIIGSLQYKTKEISNYHLSLLNVMEEILKNVKPSIITEIVKLETGTIACLWNPIDYAGDFNTQLKTLKILALFLKHLDKDKQNEELKSIKWTNLNFFQDKLKIIVQEAKSENILENIARELLNNFNMDLSNNKAVYSLYCESLVMGHKFNFYQPLNMDKFWIDINHCPKTVSFQGRLRLHSTSEIEMITVIVKVQKMDLKNNDLLIHFCQPEFSKHSQHLSAISERVIKLKLPQEEKQRLKENSFVLDYFNQAETDKKSNEPKDDKKQLPLPNDIEKETLSKTFDVIDPVEVTHPVTFTETPKPSRINSNSTKDRLKEIKTPTINNENLQPRPIRSVRTKRKFFSNLEDLFSDEETKKKKRPKTRKPRSTKSNKKQISKVLPAVELTHNNAVGNIMNIIDLTDDLNSGVEKSVPTKASSNVLTSQHCAEILKSVSDIYNIGDTSYAEPCQSYRNFKVKPIVQPLQKGINLQHNNTKKVQIKLDKNKNEMTKNAVSVKKEHRDNTSFNKENISPGASKNKRRISLQLFGSQSSNEVPPEKKSRSPKTSNDVCTVNMEINLTSDNESSPYEKSVQHYNLKTTPKNQNKRQKINGPLEDISDVEVSRTGEKSAKSPTPYSTPNIFGNITTPSSAGAMNISDLNDSDVELVSPSKKPNFNMAQFRNEDLRKNKVNKILMDWNTNFDVNDPTHNVMDEEQILNETSSTLNLNNSNEIFDITTKCAAKRKTSDLIAREFLNDCPTRVNKRRSVHDVENNQNITLKDIEPTRQVQQTKPYEINDVANNLELDNFDENLFLKESVVLQKRDDSEDSDSSEDSYENQIEPSINFLKNTDNMINEDIVIMQHMSSNINQMFRNEELLLNTPDRNCMIVSNVSTKTTTKCQVTPTTLITHQTHVYTKESVIVADIKQKMSYRDFKAKKSLIDLYNNATTDKHPQLSVENVHQKIGVLKEILPIHENYNKTVPYSSHSLRENDNVNNALMPIKETNKNQMIPSLVIANVNNGTSFIHSNNTDLTAKKHFKEINRNLWVSSSTLANKPVKIIVLKRLLPAEVCRDNTMQNDNLIAINKNNLTDTNENHQDSLIVSITDNTFKPAAYSTVQSTKNDFITAKSNKQTEGRLNLQDIENANSFIESSPTLSEALEYGHEIFKNDVSELVNNYEAKRNVHLKNARRQCLTNASDLYTQKLCEITESVLQKSKEQKNELELLRQNIEHLVTQMVCLYQSFVEKSKEHDNFQKKAEEALDALEELNIKNRISTEYKDLINQFNSNKEEDIQEVWSNYINGRVQKFQSYMEDLSKI